MKLTPIIDNEYFQFSCAMLKMIETMKEGKPSEEFIKALKIAVREYAHKPISDTKYINADWDHYIALFPLPEDIETEEQAHEYFEEHYRMTYRYTYYDCTGQAFTSWYKVFKRNNRFYCYHSVQYDV